MKDEYKRRFLSLNDSQSDQFVRLGTDEGTMGDPGHKSLQPGDTPDTRHITMIDGGEEKLTPERHNETDTGQNIESQDRVLVNMVTARMFRLGCYLCLSGVGAARCRGDT